MVKRLFVCLLALVLAFPCATGLSEAAEAAPVLTVVTTWDAGLDITSDSWFFQTWGERVGVKFDVSVYPRDSYRDKVNTLLASGDIPDILRFFQDTTSMNEYGGALFTSLNPYLENGDLPNYAAMLEKYPDFEKVMTSPNDGNIYGFGIVQDFDFVESMWYVDNVKLNACGYDVSELTTIDKVKEAFLALKELNGKYITSTRLGVGYYSGHGSASYFGVAGGLGLVFDNARPDATNKYVMGAIDLKEQALAWLEFEHWMYENELLDPNFLSMSDQDLFAGFTSGSYPLCREQVGADSYNPDYRPLYGFEVNGFTPKRTASPNYNIGYRSPMVISEKCENKLAAMKALDYVYSPEGVEMNFVGIEGETFVRDETMPTGYRLINVQSIWTINEDGTYPESMLTLEDYGFSSWWMSGIIPGYERYNLLKFADMESASTETTPANQIAKLRELDLIGIAVPPYTMNADDVMELSIIETELNTFLQENIAAFVIGNRPLSEYDQFIAELGNFDYQHVLDIYNSYI